MSKLDRGLIDNAETVIAEWESCGGNASSYITEVIAGFSALKRDLAAAQAEERKRIIEIIHGFDSIHSGITGRIIAAILQGGTK